MPESYSRGPATRGFQFEEAAGANLSRTFPAIDYYDSQTGVAVQIRSTTQTQSPEALLAVVRRGVNRLNDLPLTLVGQGQEEIRLGLTMQIYRKRNSCEDTAMVRDLPAESEGDSRIRQDRDHSPVR